MDKDSLATERARVLAKHLLHSRLDAAMKGSLSAFRSLHSDKDGLFITAALAEVATLIYEITEINLEAADIPIDQVAVTLHMMVDSAVADAKEKKARD